ncbi:MAG: transporter substrate-binding domain-containing protein [Eubacteriales bacterium]|nr:transporter substrate-binding domain-containing protein [Eubacteriales bacterium]
MKKIVTTVLIAVMVVICVACLVACGNNVSKVKVINIKLTEEEYAFGVDKAQPELLQQINSILAEIKADGSFQKVMDKYFSGEESDGIVSANYDASKNQFVVATNAEFAPFEYMDGDKFYGVDMEIAKIIADKLGQELVIKNMDFDAVCTSVGKNGVDVAMAGLTVNETRKQSVSFTDSYYNASQVLVVNADNTAFDNCKTAKDVEAVLNAGKYTIGCQSGTTGQYYIEGDEEWDFVGITGATCKPYSNAGLAVKDMQNGQIDLVIVDEAPANAIAKTING